MKDHEIRELVTELVNTAVDFAQTQQLRDRLAGIIVPKLKELQAERKRLDFLIENNAYVDAFAVLRHLCEDEFETLYSSSTLGDPRELIDAAIAYKNLP